MAKTSTRSSTSTRRARSTDPVTAYARAVVAGKAIACKLVIKSCERHLRDLEEGPKRGLTWSPQSALFAIKFFHFMRHTKGDLGGRRLVLEPWQEFGIGSTFGWMRKDGTRRFRTSYWELPKKNGKSLIASGFGLYGLVADNEMGAEVYATATKRDQARIVFGVARDIVRMSPALRSKINVFQHTLSVDKTGSKFEPLSSDAKTADGLNPHFVIVDELHRHKTAALRNLMDYGTASRSQPLLFIITTAGDTSPDSPYAVERNYAEGLLTGAIEDDSYFAFITQADNPDKWDDPAEWVKANPNFGISVKPDKLAEMAQAARHSPTKRNDFLRFHLNIRTSDVTRAIDMDVWALNAGESLYVDGTGELRPEVAEKLKGRRCYMGVDLSAKQDITATVKVFPPDTAAGETRWILLPRFFTPEASMEAREKRDNAHYRLWHEQGFLETTPGNVIDHARVRDTILADYDLYDIIKIPYDGWNATQLAVECANKGLPMVEFIQGLRSYSMPTKEFLNFLVDHKFRHGSNPVLTYMASNLFVQKDKNENLMPTKAKSTGRIDGITCSIMGVGVAIADMADSSSYLQTEDLIVI
jgi:phage terminase large subunit-like protein